MPHQLPVLHFMSVGWEHAAWQGSYYPHDLPADWRLAYYANEFPGVLLPQMMWKECDARQLEAWMDEVSSDFKFFLALESGLADATCEEKGRILGDLLGGLVVYEDVVAPVLKELSVLRLISLHSRELSAKSALMVDGSVPHDLRSLRQLLEKLAGRLPPQTEMPVFINGSPPSIELMKNLQQLAQLMGLA